jgi:aryl-alcohol dehydrogenase-like predicted oxidoreductase
MPMGEDPNRRGGSRRWIVRAVEDSLRRLSTDHIDLYQVHRPDPAVDVEETLGALTDLVHRARRAADRPVPRHGHPHLQPARRRLALRQLERRQLPDLAGAQRLAARFDMSLPENQLKLQAVGQLATVADDAGLTMIELAIAFVVNHPGVTSAIIGPRTMEQLESQLPAADATLDAAVLDGIDEIVKPGVNFNPADTSYGEQVLEPALRRRQI